LRSREKAMAILRKHPLYVEAYRDPAYVTAAWTEVSHPGGIRAHCTQVGRESLGPALRDVFDRMAATDDVSAWQGAVVYQPTDDRMAPLDVPFVVFDDGTFTTDKEAMYGVYGGKPLEQRVEHFGDNG
jgi:hypothetical protein